MNAPAPSIAPATMLAIRQIETPRGVRAWLVVDQSAPLVALRFAFRGGAAQDPTGKPGLANMMSGLLDEGAVDLDSSAFHERLDEFAIELSFDADRDSLGGSLRTLTRHREEAFAMLKLALTQPRGGFGTFLMVTGKDWATRAHRDRSMRRFMAEVAPQLRHLDPASETAAAAS